MLLYERVWVVIDLLVLKNDLFIFGLVRCVGFDLMMFNEFKWIVIGGCFCWLLMEFIVKILDVIGVCFEEFVVLIDVGVWLFEVDWLLILVFGFVFVIC